MLTGNNFFEDKIMEKRKTALCFIDLIFLAISHLGLYVFADNFILISNDRNVLLSLLISFVICAVVNIAIRFVLEIYKNIWRYASPGIYLKLIISDFFTGIIMLLVDILAKPIRIGFASVFFIVSLHCLISVSARLAYQFLYAKFNANSESSVVTTQKINVAIVGAGNVGASLAEELIRNPGSHYAPRFFIDNDHYKYGQYLNGIPVYSPDDKILSKIKAFPIQEIIIAIPDLDAEKRSKLYDKYVKTGCKVKIYDYPIREGSEQAQRRSLREIRIEDLLFRDTIQINDSKAKDFYKDKTILVTGGGGSIGSELCRQIAKLSPRKLIIFDIYENNAYDIQQELIRTYGSKLDLEVIIGSVRDAARLDSVFAEFNPQIVLHAAAHKHVPLMERSPMEAIKNNVFGTLNCADCAEKYGVEKFVLISTDKAVNPTNVMGASKRMCEMIVQSRGSSNTKFVAVRFGNVLGSNGSVIPLFRKQIENGGPVTITDKKIIRYFMTIPEASQLVLQCGAMAKRGELFVLDMGKPVKIYDLAIKMIELAGYKPNEDIMIAEIGLRDGEKLYEELLIKGENLDKTDNDLIFIEKDKPFTREEIDEKLDILRDAIISLNVNAVAQALHKVVPTFKDPSEVNAKAEASKEMKSIK